jgi:hypothetical protein
MSSVTRASNESAEAQSDPNSTLQSATMDEDDDYIRFLARPDDRDHSTITWKAAQSADGQEEEHVKGVAFAAARRPRNNCFRQNANFEEGDDSVGLKGDRTYYIGIPN